LNGSIFVDGSIASVALRIATTVAFRISSLSLSVLLVADIQNYTILKIFILLIENLMKEKRKEMRREKLLDFL
jgi:hypothetical protein